MHELISPQQSETLIIAASLLLAMVGAAWGWRAAGARGIVAALAGPLVWLLWRGHVWLTRFDPQSGYFGLDKVGVLAGEAVGFIVLGAMLGWMWSRLTAKKAKNAKIEN